MRCTACHKDIVSEDNFTRFLCPSCSKFEIIRCEQCRKKSNTYKCKECGFEGP